MHLKDRVATITGGNSGIGRATAKLFVREGAGVVIAARRADAGREAVAELEALGGAAHFVQCDVRRPADCQRAVNTTLEQFGRLDILFNNAGVVPFGRAEDTDEATWDDTMDTNAKGIFLMSRAAIPVMRAQGGGVIVNTASDAGILGCKGTVAYCASKGAVVLMTKAMALDHARESIRINAVCPGETYVNRWNERSAAGGPDVEEYIASAIAAVPMGRVATPAEIASAVLFLASDMSSFMTGAALLVDGGWTAGGPEFK
jgi:NAD(P)-dependent dehydrogenase (short-subunit alcohol dehydrogenase family)